MRAPPLMTLKDDPLDMAEFDNSRSHKEASRWELSRIINKPQYHLEVSLKYEYDLGAG